VIHARQFGASRASHRGRAQEGHRAEDEDVHRRGRFRRQSEAVPAMDDAWVGSIDIAIKKAKTACFFIMPTGQLGQLSSYHSRESRYKASSIPITA
jgi:hypothetical protein